MAMERERTRPSFLDRSVLRMLPLVLVLPLAAAAFAPSHEPPAGPSEGQRSWVLHPLSRMVERSEDWQVLARFEYPESGNWTLVVWNDGAAGDGLINASEVVVITQSEVADAMVVYTLHEDVECSEPLPMFKVTGRDYLSSIRRSLQYRARVLGAAEDPLAVRLAHDALAVRVRELEKPAVSLTSAMD